MSAISSRPKVRSVENTLLNAIVAGGITVAGALLAAGVRSLSAHSRQAFLKASEKIPQAQTGSLTSLATIRRQSLLFQHNGLHETARFSLDAPEKLRIATLLELRAVGYHLPKDVALENPLTALLSAGTLNEVKRARLDLQSVLEREHHTLFIHGLTAACEGAARRVGFDSIQTLPGLGDVVRIIAVDPAGRTLVTEIHTDPSAEPGIETEVIHVTDGSCNHILDEFDQALEAEGVRSGPPDRKFTGGICETAAARAFIRNKLRPTKAVPTTVKNGDLQRPQQLNAPVRQKQK